MNEQVYNEIRNRKERLKQGIKDTIERGGRENDTLEIMLKMLESCKINVKDELKGVNGDAEA